jgi:hypothetical protein
MKTEKQKAEEILKARGEARKGIDRTGDKTRDPRKAEDQRQQKTGELAGVAMGAGLKRSG